MGLLLVVAARQYLAMIPYLSIGNYVLSAYIRLRFDLNANARCQAIDRFFTNNSEQFSIIEVLTNCVMGVSL